MKIFVDTSAWFVLYDPNENKFPAARRFFEEHKLIPAELFTSNYVLDESISLIRKKIGHSQAVIFAESLFHLSPAHKTGGLAVLAMSRYPSAPLRFALGHTLNARLRRAGSSNNLSGNRHMESPLCAGDGSVGAGCLHKTMNKIQRF